jgi:hypothetical protein
MIRLKAMLETATEMIMTSIDPKSDLMNALNLLIMVRPWMDGGLLFSRRDERESHGQKIPKDGAPLVGAVQEQGNEKVLDDSPERDLLRTEYADGEKYARTDRPGDEDLFLFGQWFQALLEKIREEENRPEENGDAQQVPADAGESDLVYHRTPGFQF